MSTALVIEPQTFEKAHFVNQLSMLAYCRVLRAESLEHGCNIMEEIHCDAVFVTVDGTSGPVTQIVKRLYDRADELVVKRPVVFILYTSKLPVSELNVLKDMDAACLPRDAVAFVCLEVLAAFYRRAARKHPITLRIKFRLGHHFVYFGTRSTHLALGVQLAKLLAALGANGTCTVEFLADLLGVTRATIKKYVHALRIVFLAAQKEANIPESHTDVVWMSRQPGGTICGVNANCIFI